MGLQVNINWQQLEKIPAKQKVAGLLGVAVLLAGLFFYFVYLPLQKDLDVQQRRLAEVQRKYNEKKAIADNLDTFKEEVRRLDEKLAQALEKLPNSAEIDKILTDVPNLAKEEELVVRSFKPGAPITKGFYAAVPLNLMVSGSYNRVAKFIEKIAKLNRIISVSDVSLKTGEQDGDEIRLNAQLLANTYTFVEPQQQEQQPTAKGSQKK